MVENKQTDEQKKALNRAVELAEIALSAAQQKFLERQFYLNMYHTYDSVLKQKQWWQAKYAHPLPFFTTEMKASFLYEGVFGQNSTGIWGVNPWDEQSREQAEKSTKLFRHQEDQSNLVHEFYEGAKNLSTFGDWFIETYWDHDSRVLQQRDEFKLALDGTIERPIFEAGQIEDSRVLGSFESNPQPQRPSIIKVPGQKETIVTKNQPDARTLYINSVWPDPKATSFSNCRYFIIRREISFNELKRLEELNRYTDIDMLKGTNLPKMPETYYDVEPYSPFIKSGNPLRNKRSSPIDEENQIVEVLEIWYPETGEVESIGNRQVYLGRTKPYLNISNPVTHIKNYAEKSKLFGVSDYRAIAPQWKIINQYQSTEADNVMYHFRGYTMVNRDAGENVKEQIENLRPGSVITTRNLGSIAHNRPDLFSPLVLQSKQDLISQAQQPMGLNEILGGATPSSNVRSQDQFATLANFGAKILSQTIRTISSGLKEVGQNWLALNYQFLDVDQTLPILGPEGVEFERLAPSDIPIWANVSVNLSADLEAKKAQKLEQMLRAINLAQAGTPGFDGTQAIKEWFKKQGEFEQVDKFFPVSEQETQLLTRAQFGLGAPVGQTGGDPALTGASQPPNPNQVSAGGVSSGTANIPTV